MTNSKNRIKIYLYTRFERFWHWLQAILIFTLLLTGFEVHGFYVLFGFDEAVEIHNFVGISWLVLVAFIAFWMLITREWKQYVPTTKKLIDVIFYYGYGIFQGKPHPVEKSPGAKHNPLQRLTYLAIAAALLPLQMATGLLYYTYNRWPDFGLAGLDLSVIAFIHMCIAFLLISFVIVHVYMTTTGHSLFSHIKAMITGWEEIYETTRIHDWETADKTKKYK